MDRLPSKSVFISEIKSKDDRVKLCGKIVSINQENGSLSIDDSTSKVEVFLNNLELKKNIKKYKSEDQIMVIGWAKPTGVDVEVLRKIEGFDSARYKQVLEVWKNVRSKNEKS